MKRPILSIILILAVVLPTFSQRILKDIAQGTDNARIFASGAFATGDTLFFAADTIDNHRISYKYYRTRGTRESTKSLIPDAQLQNTDFISQGYLYNFKGVIYGFNRNNIFIIKNDSIKLIGHTSQHNNFVNFFVINNQLCFITNRVENSSYDFWRISDSGQNVNLYKSIVIPESSNFSNGEMLAGKYFLPIFANNMSAFLVTDGTDTGTKVIENNKIGYANYQQIGNKLYYPFLVFQGNTFKYQLWRSQGDIASTTKVLTEIDSDTNYSVGSLTKFDKNLYFISYANSLQKVSKFDTTSLTLSHISSSSFIIENLQVKNQKIYYSIYDNGMVNFYENNGSIDSQKLLFSIPGSSDFRLYIGTSKIYVSRQKDNTEDVIHWVYDGTTLTKLNDLVPNIYMGSITNTIEVVGDIFYFNASDGQHGYELWRTDGTTAGTYMLKDINKKPASSYPKPMFGLGNYMYFMADDISRGNEVWRTDGTTTTLFADMNGSQEYSHVSKSDYHSSIKYRNSQIAYINAGLHQFTPNGELKSLDFLQFYPYSLPQVFKDSIFFAGSDGNIWKTDGTSAGTKKAIQLYFPETGTAHGVISNLTTVGNSLFFTSYNGAVIWKTNGSKNGTVKLKQFAGNSSSNQINHLTTWPAQDKLFFTRFNYTVSKTELWVSDGTSAGTINLKTNSLINIFGILNNKLYFNYDSELWQSDGTVNGTFKISSTYFISGMNLNNKIYLLHITETGLTAYYELDKNNNIKLLTTINDFANEGFGQPSGFVNIDDRYLLNYISTPSHQHFILTDGNGENTRKAFSLKNSLPLYNDYQFTYHNKKIYFTALDSLKGQELWIWDFECPDGYTIRDAINKDSTIVYGKNIWGQNIVGNNKTVTYDAKNSITLQPGFEAQKGTVFKTKLIGCANNTTPNTIEDTSPTKNEPLVKVNVAAPYPQLMDFLYYLPNAHLKNIYEQAKQNNLMPVSWDIATEEKIYRLDLKIGTHIVKGFLPKKN